MQVVPLDLSCSSSRWKTDVIDLQPGQQLKTLNGPVQNSTSVGVRVGFVFNAASLRDSGKVSSTLFLESADNELQGLMGISTRGRVLQMPTPVGLSRGGSIVDGPKGFRNGIGTMMVVCAPGKSTFVESVKSKLPVS